MKPMRKIDPDHNVVPVGGETAFSAVLAPVGGFFGCGPGLNPFTGWWRQVSSDGWMTCWWPMPFKKSAEIKIVNYGGSDVSVELGDIGASDWNWTDRTMYFHCDWRSENGMETDEPFDWNYLTVQGKGVYVGDTLALFNRALLPHPNGTGTWKITMATRGVSAERSPHHFTRCLAAMPMVTTPSRATQPTHA